MSVCSLYSTHIESHKLQPGNQEQSGLTYAAKTHHEPPTRIFIDISFFRNKIRCLATGAEKDMPDVHRAIAMNKAWQAADQDTRNQQGKTVRVEFDLDTDTCPLACNNFVRLLTDGGLSQTFTGERDASTATRIQAPATLKGTYLHKLIPGFIVAGGDVSGSSGLNNITSAVCRGGQFRDEKFLPFDAAGCLGMVNQGANTNAAQWFVTLSDGVREKLDARHVKFGRAVSGFEEFRAELEQCLISGASVLASSVVISDCGVVA